MNTIPFIAAVSLLLVPFLGLFFLGARTASPQDASPLGGSILWASSLLALAGLLALLAAGVGFETVVWHVGRLAVELPGLSGVEGAGSYEAPAVLPFLGFAPLVAGWVMRRFVRAKSQWAQAQVRAAVRAQRKQPAVFAPEDWF